MKLMFQDSYGKERIIGESDNKVVIQALIRQFLDDHNFKSYYTRVWAENDRLVLDVGSHTEFFIIEGITFQEWVEQKTENNNA